MSIPLSHPQNMSFYLFKTPTNCQNSITKVVKGQLAPDRSY